ncbi:MAG TPA: hypothetical protein VHZ75_00835 [Solirubrobacteraceae bacterium]|nr:hypothetical protein [Solirubrobacteraceae bacterium]
MRLRTSLLAIGIAGACAAPSSALAAWTAPVPIGSGTQSNQVASGAFGGSVLTGWLGSTAFLSVRQGDGMFSAPKQITVADPFEKVWDAGLAADGDAVVLTIRRHTPTQRIRATFVTAAGARSGPMTISDQAHSATAPQLDVAADGTAVAAWQWHDRAGWRVQAAIRRPGQARFDKPQTLSPPAPTIHRNQQRPWIQVAAGNGGRAVVTWQLGGSSDLPEYPLHVLSAGTGSVFSADQALAGAGGFADVGLAVSPSGDVQVAYLDEHFMGHVAASSLRVAQGVAGGPLSSPVVLSAGGHGTSSGPQVAAAFSQDGTATVAWAKPGDQYEQGGVLEVFTRAPGGAFGAAQEVAVGAEGVVLAGGPSGSAVLSWMHDTPVPTHPVWAVHAVTRPGAGGPFSADETISSAGLNALWPSVAMTASGDALATWVTNTSGGGDGQLTAALHPAG